MYNLVPQVKFSQQMSTLFEWTGTHLETPYNGRPPENLSTLLLPEEVFMLPLVELVPFISRPLIFFPWNGQFSIELILSALDFLVALKPNLISFPQKRFCFCLLCIRIFRESVDFISAIKCDDISQPLYSYLTGNF